MEVISNINTYLMHASQALTVCNYNEVDALIFAQLSYFPFENYTKTEKIAVPDLAAKIMQLPEFTSAYSEDKQTFIKELVRCKRYSRNMICRMQSLSTPDTRWAAFTIEIGGPDTVVIAMRGTDKTTVGWAEDFRLGYQVMGTGAQLASFRYLKETVAHKIYLTGHSKGGNNITSAFAMSNSMIRDKVIRIDNFDGPGANPEYILNYKDGYDELARKLHNFYPGGSMICMLLSDYPGETVFIKARVREGYKKLGIGGQHDPFAFLVRGNAFVRDEQTDISKILNRTIDDLVKNTSNAQRFYMVQFLERIGIPELIAGESGRIAHFIVNFISGCVRTTEKERHAIYHGIKTILESLALQAKEWIALRQTKGYNIESGVSR